MATQLTFADAFNSWDSEIKPAVIAHFGRDDVDALSQSWNDHTDALCKDGQLSDLQYHYCPSWDDTIPDDDGEFTLDAMGVTFASVNTGERTDGLMSDMPAGSTHWRVLIKRGTKEIETRYSMGPAHTGEPDGADVFGSLLMDTSDVEGETFENWADNLGFDTDSRKAERIFEACQKTLLNLKTMFNKSELDDLREMFADR